MTKFALVFYAVVGTITLVVGLCTGQWEPAIGTLGAGIIWFGLLAFGRWAGGEWV